MNEKEIENRKSKTFVLQCISKNLEKQNIPLKKYHVTPDELEKLLKGTDKCWELDRGEYQIIISEKHEKWKYGDELSGGYLRREEVAGGGRLTRTIPPERGPVPQGLSYLLYDDTMRTGSK